MVNQHILFYGKHTRNMKDRIVRVESQRERRNLDTVLSHGIQAKGPFGCRKGNRGSPPVN